MSSSFYPVNIGRASSALSFQRLIYQINHDQLSIQGLQQQISTGRRISTPSEDPGSAIRALATQRQLEFKSQTDINLKNANTILGATESTLSQIQAIIQDIRGLAISAASNTLSSEERDAAVAQIDAAYQRLTELGNSKFQDQYIFAGSKVAAPPFQVVNDSTRFSGNFDELNTISDAASVLAANVSAEDAFGVLSDQIVGSVDLNPSLTAATALSQLHGGAGIRKGAVEFSDGINAAQVDLSKAHDLQDVLDAINTASVGSRRLQATLSSNGLSISYQDGLGGILKVAEVGSGSTANDLGIKTTLSTSQSPVHGTDIDTLLTPTTLLSQLVGGVGIAQGQLLQLKQGNRTYVISTNGAKTVEDLLNLFRRSGAAVEASIDSSGRRISIRSLESGTTFSIGEYGGTLAADLGLRTFNLSTSVNSLNFGQGIGDLGLNDDLSITRNDGTELNVSLRGVQSIGDVINRINNHVDNFSSSKRIVASLNTIGNGIVLRSPAGANNIAIRNDGGSQTAWGLGLVPRGEDSAAGVTTGGQSVITGLDVSGVEVEGVFTSLKRFKQALINDTSEDMALVASGIEADLQRLSLARGVIGARQQAVEQMQVNSADQQVILKAAESNELDTDLAQVISNLSSRQAALEASLRLMATNGQLTLFNYL